MIIALKKRTNTSDTPSARTAKIGTSRSQRSDDNDANEKLCTCSTHFYYCTFLCLRCSTIATLAKTDNPSSKYVKIDRRTDGYSQADCPSKFKLNRIICLTRIIQRITHQTEKSVSSVHAAIENSCVCVFRSYEITLTARKFQDA